MNNKIERLTTLDDLKERYPKYSIPKTLKTIKIVNDNDNDNSIHDFKTQMLDFLNFEEIINQHNFKKLYVQLSHDYDRELVGEIEESDEEWEQRLNKKLKTINTEEASILKREKEGADAVTKRYRFYLETKKWVEENGFKL